MEHVAGLAKEFVRTANSNPVIGLGLGIVTVDVLFRANVLSFVAVAAFYGFTGAQVSSELIRAITSVIPFTQQGAATEALQPTATTLSYGSDQKVTSTVPTREELIAKGYQPQI